MTTVGFIYKIVNTQEPDIVCYIGSTCKTLRQRLRIHNCTATNTGHRNYTTPFYIHMRAVGRDQFTIHLIEGLEFDDKKVLLTRERHWIETLSPVHNVTTPIVSAEEKKARVAEWFAANKAHVVEYKKQLYQQQKASIQAKTRLSPMVECPCSTRQFKESNRGVHNKNLTHRAWLQLQIGYPHLPH